ncbi:hypothetical protein DRW07_16710 [Alteromonas sediminis]|uniref:Exo-alpha-sialidase n=1 Tax=Alteromonas sediminis TaxID=2259342 RepID=A0A3N5XWZ2_9ALTE|nr:hypothetical protein [Alteromonas sediminis]RPJ64960.1 hypothetical protein DRW07_16710 [Alteromonas sediminis]
MRFKIEQILQVSSKGPHCAFVDLLNVADGLLVCYRKAVNHVSSAGTIETALIEADNRISHRQQLCFPSVDLRDPKLSLMPNGKVLLIAYARHHDQNNKTTFSQSVCWFSDNGKTWSSPRYFGPAGWWLWRLRWHEKLAYGIAYNRAANRVDLYRGNPLGSMECVKHGILSLEKHGKGYPNESDIWFDGEGVLHALVRRDADTYSAMWGRAAFPYTRWQWTDLSTYIGGPVLIELDPDLLIVAGRTIESGRLKTAVWLLSPSSASLQKQLVLPSAGDNSYPGLVTEGDNLWIAYYSMHIDRQSRVYLAHLTLQ